jgi:2-(1,2-epoxy-1,2-dihydrophenyl)acetyl-CoA isomerase
VNGRPPRGQIETAGRIFRMPKPVIASLPGAAAGAGLSLALACDLRIAAESAILTTAFAKVGFSGDYGGTFLLPKLELGLVNRVVADAALESETRALAQRLASGATIAYRYMKENIGRALSGASLEACLDMEATHRVHTGLTQDHRDAAKAFVEKRAPVFKGR